jgi:hypothetical protein
MPMPIAPSFGDRLRLWLAVLGQLFSSERGAPSRRALPWLHRGGTHTERSFAARTRLAMIYSTRSNVHRLRDEREWKGERVPERRREALLAGQGGNFLLGLRLTALEPKRSFGGFHSTCLWALRPHDGSVVPSPPLHFTRSPHRRGRAAAVLRGQALWRS